MNAGIQSSQPEEEKRYEEKKYIVLREEDFRFHPVICVYHAGYYQGISEYVIGSKKISVEETKCVFKGGPYNEYVITWD